MYKLIVGFCLILLFSFAGYFIERKIHVHRHVRNISEKFVRIANKSEADLYAKRERLDPAFSHKHIIPTNQLVIDVVIPVVEKDLETVGYTIESIRKLVNHKIGKIYLVAPNRQVIKNFANMHRCEFVHEDKVLPSVEIKKFGGWIVQQFIKLNADQFVTNDHYLVVDADTIFLRPVVFVRKNAYLINVHWDCCQYRKKFTSTILNNNKTYRYDFVSHHMLFSKVILKQMKAHIEKNHGDTWYNSVLKLFSKDQLNIRGFSEYEIYTTYLTEFTSEKFRFVSNANITVHRNFLNNIDKIIPAYANDYKIISMHSFIQF